MACVVKDGEGPPSQKKPNQIFFNFIGFFGKYKKYGVNAAS